MKAGSRLERVLAAGHFAVTGELGPPQSADGDVVRRKAALLKGFIDAANVTDNPRGVVRMSSIAACYLALQEGLEPVVQMTCRDRNRISLQSDVLGMAPLGLKNLLCLTGDHHSYGNHPVARGVFDLDSIHLIQMVRVMRDERRFQSGDPMKVAPRLFIGGVANPFVEPFEFRVVRLAKKVEAGADFIQTQLIYNVERFARWMELVRQHGLHKRVYILAGVGPIKSAGMARYMREHVPGLDVPEEIVRRMERRGSEDARREGLTICLEIVEQVRRIEGVAGLHLMSIGWEEAIPEIVERAGLFPRPRVEEGVVAAASGV